MEMPFCMSWPIKSQVFLFQSHGTPGGVPLNSSFSEGEGDLGNLIILTVISCSKPVSHQIENCDMLFNSAFTCYGVVATVKDMGRWVEAVNVHQEIDQKSSMECSSFSHVSITAF